MNTENPANPVHPARFDRLNFPSKGILYQKESYKFTAGRLQVSRGPLNLTFYPSESGGMAGLGGIGLTGEIFSIFLIYCSNKKIVFEPRKKNILFEKDKISEENWSTLELEMTFNEEKTKCSSNLFVAKESK